MLLFYFGSHGTYDAERGTYAFSTYDGHLPFTWAFESIERYFKGPQVLMFADCCHSGGIVDIARQLASNHAYACLSSTFSHNYAWSGWRFIGCLMRGLEGDPVVDLNGDGKIELEELARYTEKHMAFVAEGRPMFVATNGFNPGLVLAETDGKKSSPEIGNYIEAKVGGKWLKAEIIDTKPGKVEVRFADSDDGDDTWIPREKTRAFQFPRYAVGARVEVKAAGSGKWYPATVLGSWESLSYCRYDDWSPAYDEWVGPGRIRPAR